MSRHCEVRTTVDNKHNCEDKIGRVLIMQNYIYKTQYGQYDAKNNVETGHNKKYPFPQVQSCPLPSLTHKTKRTQADYLTNNKLYQCQKIYVTFVLKSAWMINTGQLYISHCYFAGVKRNAHVRSNCTFMDHISMSVEHILIQNKLQWPQST